MNAETMCYHYSNEGQDEKQTLVDIIKENAPAEAIFLLGQTIVQRRTETVFTCPSASLRYTSHHFLLVLVDKETEHALNAIQDKIENNLQHFRPSTVLVLPIQSFNQWLLQGHRFAFLVIRKAAKLYDAENIPFNQPAEINEGRSNDNRQIFTHASQKIAAFLASAELHRLRQEYKLSAFMLHQAAEQALRAMLVLNTGLKINTHSIDKLIRYGSMFCEGLHQLFPKQNEKTKKLSSLLNKAYIDTRYKDDYSISREELAALTEKVKIIKALFEKFKPGLPESR